MKYNDNNLEVSSLLYDNTYPWDADVHIQKEGELAIDVVLKANTLQKTIAAPPGKYHLVVAPRMDNSVDPPVQIGTDIVIPSTIETWIKTRQ
jgi:hypothetical protein